MPEIVTDDGTKIAYSTWGRRDGTPVVLIQGLGMDSRGWALQRGAFGRLQRRLGVFVNVLARVLIQAKPEAFIAQVDAILNASDELRFELPDVKAPTLVITGSQDTLTPLGDAEEVAELIPDARLYVLRG